MIDAKELTKLLPLKGLAGALEAPPDFTQSSAEGLYWRFIRPFDARMHDDAKQDSLRRQATIGESTVKFTAEHKVDTDRDANRDEIFRRLRTLAIEVPVISDSPYVNPNSIHLRIHSWHRGEEDDERIIGPRIYGSIVGPPPPPAIAGILGIAKDVAESIEWERPGDLAWKIKSKDLPDSAKTVFGVGIKVMGLITPDMLQEVPVVDDDYYL
jgi:hypothetical protein